MGSGCGIPHRGQSPSSARQLPILAALHARSPTLFGLIIHHMAEKVNTLFDIFLFISYIIYCVARREILRAINDRPYGF